MLLYKMYKLEKIAHDMEEDTVEYWLSGDTTNVLYNGLPLKVSGIEDVMYLKAIKTIPYEEALKHVDYLHNRDMDESDELFWIEELGKQYNLDCFLVTLRLRSVDKLSSSFLFKNKLEELYSDNVRQRKK